MQEGMWCCVSLILMCRCGQNCFSPQFDKKTEISMNLGLIIRNL